MVVTYKVQHDRKSCIGCGACVAACPAFWEMNADGKSDIIGGKTVENEVQEREIEEKDYPCNKEAADSCPVNVIHIINLETKEKLI